MARVSRPTFKKRQKELARQERQQSKQAQRRAKSELRKGSVMREDGEDPDISGIRPGPQPLPTEGHNLPDPVRPKDPKDSSEGES